MRYSGQRTNIYTCLFKDFSTRTRARPTKTKDYKFQPLSYFTSDFPMYGIVAVRFRTFVPDENVMSTDDFIYKPANFYDFLGYKSFLSTGKQLHACL